MATSFLRLELHARLLKALDIQLEENDNWKPDTPEKIMQVIELNGLHIERHVKVDPRPAPIDPEDINWEWHVWSLHPVYRFMHVGDFYGRRGEPRVIADDLTTAVLYWAVLRAERVKELRECPVMSKNYVFERLNELVYFKGA